LKNLRDAYAMLSTSQRTFASERCSQTIAQRPTPVKYPIYSAKQTAVLVAETVFQIKFSHGDE
jgi:hypothetical protein